MDLGELKVKNNNVIVTITNRSNIPMKYRREWYDHGRVADGFFWPAVIDSDHPATVLIYEVDWSVVGCSGYVEYEMSGMPVGIAFSNPSVGTNKLGVGITGDSAWEGMDYHNYEAFVVPLTIAGKSVHFNCICTGGSTNKADVKIFST